MKEEDLELFESIEDLLAQGKEKKEIQEALEITPQKYGMVLKAGKALSDAGTEVTTSDAVTYDATDAVLVNEKGYSDKVKVETAKEYRERHEKAGTPFGRKKGTKTKLTPEELRILITERWTEKDIMAKHGITTEELGKVAMALSRMERDSKVQIERG